jgi:hypothetical protein
MGLYRRFNKNGTITWSVQYFHDGVRHREAVGPSKREAELVLGKKQAAIREHKFFAPPERGPIGEAVFAFTSTMRAPLLPHPADLVQSHRVCVVPTQRCVYLHSVNGEVFYVGAGTLSRPFATTARNKKWAARVHAVGTYDISVALISTDQTLIRDTEQALIQKFRPLCNSPRFAPYRKARRSAQHKE